MIKAIRLNRGSIRLALLSGFLTSLSHLAHAGPANDNFADAIPLSGAALVTGSNLDATNEISEPVHAGQLGGASVWWTWSPSHSSSVTISTAGSNFDTLLAVYTGANLASLTEVAANDDVSFVETTSRVVLMGVSGTTYHIAVDGFEADSGDIRLSILDHDNFEDRLVLSGASVTVTSHNVSATSEVGEPPHAGQTSSHSVWWSWTAPANGAVALTLSGDNVSVEGGTFYKLLAAYTGSSIGGLALVASQGGTFTLTNQLQFNVSAGVTYQIVADGVAGASGGLRLELGFTHPPPNDLFADRLLLDGTNVTVNGSNVGAAKEFGEPDHAGSAGGHSIWWTWTAPTNGSATFAVSGTILSKLLAIYSGDSVSNLTIIGSKLSADPTNRISFDVVAGAHYEIAVDGLSGQVGDIVLNLQFKAGPANDPFADRLVLAGASLAVAGSNVGATPETGEPNHGGYAASRSVWWSWMAPANGSVTVTVSGDNLSSGGGPFYKLIGIYSGTSLASLVTNKLSSGLSLTNRVTFDVVSGMTYQIAVDGHNGAHGAFVVALAFTSAPPNDHFTDRVSLIGSVVTVAGSSVAATKQGGEPNHAGPGGRSVWWTWTAPASGSVAISTAGSTFNTLLAVYLGAAVTSLTPVASNNDFAGLMTSQVTFNAVEGTTYQIAVDGLLQDSGIIHLTLSQLGASRLESITYAPDGTFQFTLIGQAATNYVIEASTNLVDWMPLATVTNSMGSLDLADPAAGMLPQRFYRAKLQ